MRERALWGRQKWARVVESDEWEGDQSASGRERWVWERAEYEGEGIAREVEMSKNGGE
jgi:hypothetical protein